MEICDGWTDSRWDLESIIIVQKCKSYVLCFFALICNAKIPVKNSPKRMLPKNKQDVLPASMSLKKNKAAEGNVIHKEPKSWLSFNKNLLELFIFLVVIGGDWIRAKIVGLASLKYYLFCCSINALVAIKLKPEIPPVTFPRRVTR